MDTSHSLSVFCCASQNFIRRDPNTPQLPHGNLMHRDRLRRRQRDLASASRAVRCAGRHRDPPAHLPNQHRLRAFQSILSLAQLSGSSSVQENVWRRRGAHEECLDVRSVGEDLHGERVVCGEKLQLIVHGPLRRIGLRQVIDCTEKNGRSARRGRNSLANAGGSLTPDADGPAGLAAVARRLELHPHIHRASISLPVSQDSYAAACRDGGHSEGHDSLASIARPCGPAGAEVVRGVPLELESRRLRERRGLPQLGQLGYLPPTASLLRSEPENARAAEMIWYVQARRRAA